MSWSRNDKKRSELHECPRCRVFNSVDALGNCKCSRCGLLLRNDPDAAKSAGRMATVKRAASNGKLVAK